jgi:hypothetical protein
MTDGHSSVALRRVKAWLPDHARNERPSWRRLAPGPRSDPSHDHPAQGWGLARTREECGRRSLILTSEGHAQLEEGSARLGDPFANFADTPNRPDLTDPLHQLPAAVRSIEVTGDATQLKATAKILVQATMVAVFDLGRGGRRRGRVS